ncbi:hypothetical protein ABZ949_02415 [Micromonospora tulbaghiae]|uniref:hypothetical protein n=1 Tax=Micromonospora tulbaghiae TaxID=479978 RepID=UPI0033C1D588
MSRRRRVWIHRALAALWAVLAIPAVLWWKTSILFVILVSLYANFAAEIASSEAADDRNICDRLDRIEQALHRNTPGSGDG